MINWEQKTKLLLRAVFEADTPCVIEEFGIHKAVEMAEEVITGALAANEEFHRALDESVNQASETEEQVSAKKYQEHVAMIVAAERREYDPDLNDAWFSEKPKDDE